MNEPLLSGLACSASSRGWKIEARVRVVAGAMLLISLLLSLMDRRWLLLSAFIGVNLLQSGLTGWCLMSNLLAILDRKRPRTDVQA
ncbi:MAG: YgaP family membrane protein [Vulcanimicrobiaceae bacterium]